MPAFDSPVWSGVFLALLASVFIAAASFFSLRRAAGKSHKVFANVLFGGMILRLIVIGGLVYWVWRHTALDGVAFTVTLLGTYVLFQLLETLYFQKHFQRMKTVRRV